MIDFLVSRGSTQGLYVGGWVSFNPKWSWGNDRNFPKALWLGCWFVLVIASQNELLDLVSTL